MPIPDCFLATPHGLLNLASPDLKMLSIEDIAQSLSALPRWGGMTARKWSVAQHSLMMEMLVAPKDPVFRLANLLHDAPEAYFRDIPSPLRPHLGSVFTAYQQKLEQALQEHYQFSFLDVNYELDHNLLLWEANNLLLASMKKAFFETVSSKTSHPVILAMPYEVAFKSVLKQTKEGKLTEQMFTIRFCSLMEEKG